jgi:5-formyltetrahydrofolate cyclo-ligase
MTIEIQRSKSALRHSVLRRLGRMSATERATLSTQARSVLQQQPCWHQAKSALLFAPMAGELDIWPLVTEALTAGKVVALPRFVPQTSLYEACPIEDPVGDLVAGRFGIREPAPRCAGKALNMLDIILVPGIAFDLHGRRLGRGRGFYDRLLAAVRGTRCGVAFDEQIVREIPAEPHDALLNCILTPTRWVQL